MDYLRANYHTHTTRCGHATGSDRDYVEAAISAGMEILGFSDHVFFPKGNPYSPTVRMDFTDVENYLHSIQELREEYADRIRILIGFEMEYIPYYYDEQMKTIRELGFDYLILGQHFLGDEKHGVYIGNRTDDEERLAAYVELAVEGASKGVFSYLAHPDLPFYVGRKEAYEKHMRRLCEEMKALGIPLEINLHGMLENRHYPSETFWKIAGETGNRVVIGADAHAPDEFSRKDLYLSCRDMFAVNGLLVEEELEMPLRG